MHIYRFPATRVGFYTAVFDAYADKEAFLSCSDRQFSLEDTERAVTPDEEKTLRVKRKLKQYDKDSLHDIDYILRSDGKDKENAAFRYIRCICRAKGAVRERFADPDVFKAQQYRHKVAWEMDKMYGFLRFVETESGVLYAPYEPDCDLTELIVWHFIARFHGERFVIHDKKRKKAAVYNGKDCIVTEFHDPDLYLSANEKDFESLWKTYYDAVNIQSRPHEKQMKGAMPVRYWKYLPEKH